MKKYILSLLLCGLINLTYAQVTKNVKKILITLKTGYTSKGEVIEEVPNEFIKIKTVDGTILNIKFLDIEKIEVVKIIIIKPIRVASAGLISGYYASGVENGITTRYRVNKKIALGLNGSYIIIPDKIIRRLLLFSNFDYYYLSDTKIKPFIGIEIGVVRSSYELNFQDFSDMFPNILLGSSFGIDYEISNRIDLSLKIKYNRLNLNSALEYGGVNCLGFNIGLSYKFGSLKY